MTTILRNEGTTKEEQEDAKLKRAQSNLKKESSYPHIMSSVIDFFYGTAHFFFSILAWSYGKSCSK